MRNERDGAWLERQRRRSAEEKLTTVRESLAPGKLVSMAASQHRVKPNQL
jgi:transposase-like protein